MKRLVIESPYAGDVEDNIEFARVVCLYAIYLGYAPIASHLLYTQFLDDDIQEERMLGIEAGLAWSSQAEEVWFCLQEGAKLSKGMSLAMDRYTELQMNYSIKYFTWDGMDLNEVDSDAKS